MARGGPLVLYFVQAAQAACPMSSFDPSSVYSVGASQAGAPECGPAISTPGGYMSSGILKACPVKVGHPCIYRSGGIAPPGPRPVGTLPTGLATLRAKPLFFLRVFRVACVFPGDGMRGRATPSAQSFRATRRATVCTFLAGSVRGPMGSVAPCIPSFPKLPALRSALRCVVVLPCSLPVVVRLRMVRVLWVIKICRPVVLSVV